MSLRVGRTISCGVVLLVTMFLLEANAQLPEKTLTSAVLKSLVYGKTAEVDFGRAGKGLLYFSPNGELRQVKNNRLKKGHWKVNKAGRLCSKLKGQDWNCRILVAKGTGYRQYIVKKNGQHKKELTYKAFHPGRKLKELVRSPILPGETLSKKELTTLFSDQTVESETVNKSRISWTYYSPRGTVEQLRNGVTRNGKWRVTKDDRICLQMLDLKEKCRIIVKDGGSYKKYIVRKDGQHQHSVTYLKFRPGRRL